MFIYKQTKRKGCIFRSYPLDLPSRPLPYCVLYRVDPSQDFFSKEEAGRQAGRQVGQAADSNPEGEFKPQSEGSPPLDIGFVTNPWKDNPQLCGSKIPTSIHVATSHITHPGCGGRGQRLLCGSEAGRQAGRQAGRRFLDASHLLLTSTSASFTGACRMR
jgi:hypothetical protein